VAAVNNNNNNPSKPSDASADASVPMRMVESKCAELFANYCDMLLRKTNLSRHLTLDQIESKLKNVVSVGERYAPCLAAHLSCFALDFGNQVRAKQGHVHEVLQCPPHPSSDSRRIGRQ